MNSTVLENINHMLKIRNINDELVKITNNLYCVKNTLKIYFVDQITALFLRTIDSNIPLNIIIYSKSATYDVLKKTKNKHNLQIFHIDKFIFNLSLIIPTHRFWKKSTATDHNYPKILLEDPAIQYYNFSKDDLIIIEENIGPMIFKVI